jgi:lysophospholipid acyltransferase (LPLAT)-like uncharacterized protein
MRIRSPVIDRILAWCLVALFRLLFRTLRIQYHEADPRTNPYTGDGPAVIYSVWHDVMVYSIFAGRHQRTTALVSKHGDGTLLANCLQQLGIGLVRGSSSRSAADALRSLIRLPADRNVVVTPDGPRGPEHQMKSGVTLLASRTGRAVVPSGFASTRSWKIPGSWTSLEVPCPFTTVYFLTGAPINIAAETTRDELDAKEHQIQNEMDRLTALARRFATTPA